MLIYPTIKMAPIQGLTGFGGGATGYLAGAGASGGLYDFTTHTFTRGGATGKNGPTHSALVSAYSPSWASDSNFFTQGDYQGYQKWKVPETAVYEFELEGAGGGKHLYGEASVTGSTFVAKGARVTARLSLTEGDWLQLVVGQRGGDSQASDASEGDNAAPGGGGASWVFVNATDSLPLFVAGAGAGGTRNTYANANASTSNNGNNSQMNGESGYSDKGLGGTGGNGGRRNDTGGSYWSGGGAGWLTNGTAGNQTTDYVYTAAASGESGEGGRNPDNGLIGGTRHNDGTDSGGDGGFGGGGGGSSDNAGTGGGAGYSGGAGGSSTPNNGAGGGGGSFATSSATNVSITQAPSWNHGYIKITKI